MKDTSRGLLNLLLKRLRIDASVSERSFPIHAAAEAIQKHYEEKCIKTADETRRNTLNFVLDTLGIGYAEAQPVGSITPDSGYIAAIRKHYEDRAKAREVQAAARARAELLEAALSPNASAWQDDIGRVTNERGTAEVWAADGYVVEPLYTKPQVPTADRKPDGYVAGVTPGTLASLTLWPDPETALRYCPNATCTEEVYIGRKPLQPPEPREADLVKLSDQLRAERDELQRLLSVAQQDFDAAKRVGEEVIEERNELQRRLADLTKQKPVAWRAESGQITDDRAVSAYWRGCGFDVQSLYAAPKPATQESTANPAHALPGTSSAIPSRPGGQEPVSIGIIKANAAHEALRSVLRLYNGEPPEGRNDVVDAIHAMVDRARQVDREPVSGTSPTDRILGPRPTPFTPQAQQIREELEGLPEHKRAELPTHDSPPKLMALDSPALIEADRLVREGWEPIPDSLEWVQHRFVRNRPHQRVGMETILAMYNLAADT